MMTARAKIPNHHAPQTPRDHINWLRLTRSRRVGPATFVRLLHQHASVQDALEDLPQLAQNAGVKGYQAYDVKAAEREYDAGLHMGFRPLFLGMPGYPSLLAETPDAPPFLWAAGAPTLADKTCLALVGARNASSLSRRFTRSLVHDLCDMGYVIVSGLARGIDTEAHLSSVDTGTIAVQAGGLDIAYPQENAGLMDRIGTKGLRLSEQPIGLIPQARHFPQRNRIIAGLAQAVLVIEGAARSGSLITARNALDLGREVMAVPGHPLDGRAAGCNMLIRDGAALVRTAEDVRSALDETHVARITDGLSLPEPAKPRPKERVHEKILALLGANDVDENDVIRDAGLPAHIVAESLTSLELDGQITRKPGGKLARTG